MNQPHPHINIPEVAIGRITPEVISKTDLLLKHIAVEKNIRESEEQLAATLGCSSQVIRQYKKELRKIFSIPDRAPIKHLSKHPQIHAALHSILVREKRSDELQLRGAKGLYVVADSGELITVENYLKYLYSNPDAPPALHCYTGLIGRWKKKMVRNEEGKVPLREELPSDVAVVRWIGKMREKDVLVKLGRMRENDLTKELGYVTRNPDDYAPGETWIGDHTEHPWELYNEETGRIEHWWVSGWIDMRTGIIPGYEICRTPSSDSIALAFRNAVLGTQLHAVVETENGEAYKEIKITNVPQEIIIDNGKDYRSKYTQKLFGKVDFTDRARTSIEHVYTKLHYAQKYHAQTKGPMEVWWRTYQRMLKYLPAFRGSNYSKKPDSHKIDMKSGNMLTVGTFKKMFHAAVTTYNNRVRRRLNKMSPLQYYLTYYTIQRTIDIRTLDFLMMRTPQEGRLVEHSQVWMFKKPYYSDALLQYNGKRVDVYYDPHDLGFVSVYCNGEFAAVATNKEMFNQTERGWIKIVNDRKAVLKGIRDSRKEAVIGLSGIDAKYDLLAGQLMNVSPVSAELLNKQVPEMIIRTGVEEKAKEVHDELKQQKQVVAIEHEVKKRYKNKLITKSMIDRL